MSSTLDPQDIYKFLDARHGEPQNASLDCDRSVPRVNPSFDRVSVEPSSADWDHQSNYTMTPTSVESLFSRDTGGNPSSVGGSTAPSDHHRPRFEQQFTYGPAGAVSSFELWCEFSDLFGCGETFRGDDEVGWVQHHIAHLRDKIPAQLTCWFCDEHIPFLAERTADRGYNFGVRMAHIRSHISDDYQTLESMRPDFYMVKHLHKHHFIDDRTYNYLKTFNEVPQQYRLPDSDSRPPGQAKPREQGEYYDLENEERRRKRQNKDTKYKDGRKRGDARRA